MYLTMSGLDYSAAPIALREQLSFTRNGVVDMDRIIAESGGLLGVVLLSTCNRTELYLSCAEGDVPDAGEVLCRAAGVRGQLIPYRAVGVERGLLLALRSDGVRVDGREQGELLVALSPTPVDGGEGIQALLGAWEDRGPARAPGPHRHGRERKA